MSGHSTVAGVEHWRELPAEYLAAAALAVRAVGFREITDENWPEVWARIHLHEALWGAWTNAEGDVAYFAAPGDVKRLVGLQAWGSPPYETSRLAYLDDLLDSLIESAKDQES